MRKTLHLYIFREITTLFLLGFAVFTVVLLTGRFIKLANLVIAKGVPVADVIKLIAYLLPSFSFITIPMALLLAVLLAFSRLSSDSEITAIKTSGISLYGLLPSVMAFSFLAYIATAIITIYALPWGNTSFKTLMYDVINTRVNVSLKEQIFNDDLPGLMIYVDRHDEAKHLLSGILVYDDRNSEEPVTIFAEQGMIVTDPEKKTVRLRLLNGTVHSRRGKSDYRLMEFASYDVSINFTASDSATPSTNQDDMTFRGLQNALKVPGIEEREQRKLSLELHRRLAFPFACFIFGLVGVPLGLQNSRSGKSSGFSLCIALLLIYYIILMAGRTLGQNGILSPAVSMWLPNLIFLGAGAYLFKTTADEKKILIFTITADIIAMVRKLPMTWRKAR